jgi:hypothetical protein
MNSSPKPASPGRPTPAVASVCHPINGRRNEGRNVSAELVRGQLCALDPRLDLAKGSIAAGGGIIGEGRETAVIRGSELIDG